MEPRLSALPLPSGGGVRIKSLRTSAEPSHAPRWGEGPWNSQSETGPSRLDSGLASNALTQCAAQCNAVKAIVFVETVDPLRSSLSFVLAF
jgi:hypothetical protein